MPARAKSMCRKQGCPALLDAPGYCARHQREQPKPFSNLDGRKTPEQKRFYSSRGWTEASLQHRATEPLCRRCRAAGRVTEGEMVHHNPPLEELLASGENPLSDRFLETLCNRCHLEELRGKKTVQAVWVVKPKWYSDVEALARTQAPITPAPSPPPSPEP